MEFVLETLNRLQSQQHAILRVAMGRAQESDLDSDTLETLGICISECLDDAFYSQTEPLLAELEEHDRRTAIGESHADIADYHRRVR